MRHPWSAARSPVVLAAFFLVAGPAASDEVTVGDYHFSVDGRAEAPPMLHVHGETGAPAPGDLVHVDGTWLRLGSERRCRFSTAPEGGAVFIETDGVRRVVAIDVDRQPALLATLSRDDLRELWALRSDSWTPQVARMVSALDPARSCLTLGQTTSDSGLDLPALPAGLVCLDAKKFLGWDGLASLPRLEALFVLPDETIDARVIRHHRHLRALAVGTGDIVHPEALAGLAELRYLDLPFGTEASLEFARGLVELRRIDVHWSEVSDLGPLGSLPRLEWIDAGGAHSVRGLPDGPAPALRFLDVMSTSLTDDAVAAFRLRHPEAEVRHRWADALAGTIADADQVRAVVGEGCGLDDDPARVLWESTDPAEIAQLARLVRVDEPDGLSVCMCIGGPALRFLRGEDVQAELRIACGHSLRWSGWPSDAPLDEDQLRDLVEFLADRGIEGPRREWLEQQAAAEAYRARFARATAGWSGELRELLRKEEAWPLPPKRARSPLAARLAAEHPRVDDQIDLLLRAFGADDDWNGIGGHDVVVDNLLRSFDPGDVERAIERALRGTEAITRRGAARFWLSGPESLAEWRAPADLRTAAEAERRATSALE